MANPFDQFDAAPTAPKPFAARAAAAPNPFDQFDAPKPANDSKPESSWLETGWDTIKQLPSAFEKAGGGLLRAMGDSGGYVPPALDMGPNDPEASKLADFNAEVAKNPNSPSSIGKLVSDHAEQSLIANAPNVPAGSAKHYANMLGLGIGQMAPALLGTVLTRSAAPILAQTAAMSLGTNYADAINATPNDPDAAFSKAASLATVDTAAAAISIKAFGIQPFTSAMGKITNEATGEFATVYRQTIGDMIKNVMVQGIAIQPAIAVVNRGVDNWINGRPITEGFGDEYITGAIQNTLVMGITHLATRPQPTMGKVQGGEPGPGFGEGPIIDGNVTPPGSGPAPAGAPRLPATIDPQDIHEGDAESPIDTSIIAEGRRIQREALQKQAQVSESAAISSRNGWPGMGSRVSVGADYMEPLTGTVHSAFSEPHPDVPGAMADGLQVQLDNGDMLRGFKHDLDAAGITITPQQAQQAGLPLDVATQPTNQPQAQAAAAEQPPAATVTQPEIAPVQAAPQSVSADMAVINGNAPPADASRDLPTPAPPPTTGDGTQSAPIVVTHPDHLTQASDLVNTAPSDAQKEAGNYTKGHIKVHGLDIAIENPADSVRSGTGPEGPWSVKMPAAYGYVKRTTGADGEQVDVYVGPNPQSSKVFVVDQKDAQNGTFDEHKVMLGMDTKQQALDTYHAAFSDGLGPQRMGGVREMNTLEFKKLLNSGVLDKPVSAPGPSLSSTPGNAGFSETSPSKTAISAPGPAQVVDSAEPSVKPIQKTPRAPLAPSTETSVLENIRRMGGIKTTDANGQPTKEGQDTQAVLKDVNRPGLINNQTGQRPDTIREHMQQQGWFGQTGGHDIQDLYDLIDKEARNGPQFHPESERGKAVAAKAEAESSERASADAHAELDHFIKESKELFSTADKAALHEQVDGGFDPLSAVVEHIERRAMREQYEHHAETKDQDYAASLEPDRERAGEVAGRSGESVEGHAPVATSEGNRDETGGTVAPPVGAPSEARQGEVKAEPGTAVDGQGKAVPQTIIPGADHSAAQLAAAREAQGHGRATTSVTQKDAGGMFAPKVEDSHSPEYAAALKAHNAAQAEYQSALGDYRARKMDTDHFIAAREKYKAATAEFDKAFAAEAKRPVKTSGAAAEETGDLFGKSAPQDRQDESIDLTGVSDPERTGAVAPDGTTTQQLLRTGDRDQILDHIAKYSPDPERRHMARVLRETIASNIKYRHMRRGEEVNENGGLRGGFYDHQRDLFTVHSDLASDPERAFLHEGVHAATVSAIYARTPTGKAIDRLFEAYHQLSGKYTWEDRGDQYGFRNSKEFVAEILTNPKFRETLDRIKGAGQQEKSLMQKFFDIIRKFFGLKPSDPLGYILDNEAGVLDPKSVLTGAARETLYVGEGKTKRPYEPQIQDETQDVRGEHPNDEPTDDHQAAIDNAWDTLISSTAKRMGWEGEPTSQAMGLKALLMPKGPEKTELARNARAIKALEDQRANPLGTRQAPIQGDGETKVRGTAQSIADQAAKGGINLDGLSTYEKSHQAPIIDRSVKFDAIPANRAISEGAAMGTEPAPYGTTQEAMLIAVQRRATREGDGALLLKLATQSKVLSDLTTAGQRISMMQNLDPMSPVAAIKTVQTARATAAKVKGGDIPKAKKDTIKDMMDTINKRSKQNAKGEPMGAAARKLRFKMFLNSVVCK